MITFFKSQKDLSDALIELIDLYWAMEYKEDNFIRDLKEIITKNQEKMFLDDGYTAVIRQRLGKRRLELVDKILERDLVK